MSTPNGDMGIKQLRVSLDTHGRIHNLAAKLNGTADDAVRHLLGESTVRVPVTDIQRARWTAQADHVGVTLAQFITLRVEAAIQFGSDPANIRQMRDILDRIEQTLRNPRT